MNKTYQINPNQLYWLYVKQELSLQEIADYYGCSRETVSSRIKEFSIPARSRKQTLQTQRAREKMSSIMSIIKHRGYDDALKRFNEKSIVIDNGCWEWQGRTAKGYGIFSCLGRQIQTHIFSYNHFKGPVPEGLHLDHLCRNRKCANPEHLEPVTPGENLRRGEAPNWKTNRENVCKNGHSMDNAIVNKDGRRRCRECVNRRWRELYYRKKSEAPLNGVELGEGS